MASVRCPTRSFKRHEQPQPIAFHGRLRGSIETLQASRFNSRLESVGLEASYELTGMLVEPTVVRLEGACSNRGVIAWSTRLRAGSHRHPF